MSKWIIGLVVIVIAAAGLWYSGWLGGKSAPTAEVATSTPQQPQVQAPQNGLSASNDNSDTALTQDAAALDAQMQGLTQDSTAVDSSLNDKPLTQSY